MHRELQAAPCSTAWSGTCSSVLLAGRSPGALVAEVQVVLGSICPLKPHGQEI